MRWSMRAVFVVMTVCCVLMGGWSVYVQPYRDQAASRDKVQSLGGEWQAIPATGPGWQRWLVTRMLDNESFVEITDVDLRNRQVKAADVAALSGLKWLKSLSLDRAEINDENSGVLTGFRDLEYLSLSYVKVTDHGLPQFADFTKLEKLYLTGVSISDDSTEQFRGSDSLKELYVRWTKISAEGARQIQQSLPQCSVFHHEILAEPLSVNQ